MADSARRSQSSRRASAVSLSSSLSSWPAGADIGPADVEAYCETVRLFSQRSQDSYLHSGSHYADLCDGFAHRVHLPEPDVCFVKAVDLVAGTPSVPRPRHLKTTHDFLSAGSRTVGPDCAQLLFLSGYPSYHRLALLGAAYGVDPEFWRRHIPQSKREKRFYDLPTLPSHNRQIVQLRVSTIFQRQKVLHPGDNKVLRGGTAEININTYHHDLAQTNQVGASMVRQLHSLDKGLYTVEQYISFTIVAKNDGWAAVVWQDSGSPLPAWLSSVHSHTSVKPNASARDSCIPVVQRGFRAAHHHHPAAHPAPAAGAAAAATLFSWTQNAMHLPEQYGEDLDVELMRASPLYALSDVFRMAVYSSSQVVNLLTTHVRDNLLLRSEMRVSDAHESEALANLQYTKSVLDDHAAYLSDMVALLGGSRPDWAIHQPEPSPSAEQQQGEKEDDVVAVVDRLQAELRDDFACLLRRTERLADCCKDGFDVILSSAQLRESQRGISQATEVGRLSKLVIIFAPLSFLTSFFGMNFLEMQMKVGLSVVLGVSFVFCGTAWWFGLFTGILRGPEMREGGRDRRRLLRQYFADP